MKSALLGLAWIYGAGAACFALGSCAASKPPSHDVKVLMDAMQPDIPAKDRRKLAEDLLIDLKAFE